MSSRRLTAHRSIDRITETKHFVSRYVIGPGLAGRAQSRRYGWELDLPAYWSTGCRNGRSARRCLAWRQARATCSGGGTSARPFRAGSIRFSWLVPGSPAGKPISACGAGPAPVCRGERNAPPAGTSSRRPGPRSSPSVNANTTPVASASPARSSRRAGPRLSSSACLPTARGAVTGSCRARRTSRTWSSLARCRAWCSPRPRTRHRHGPVRGIRAPGARLSAGRA